MEVENDKKTARKTFASKSLIDLNPVLCEELQLDSKRIAMHQTRITQALRKEIDTTIPVVNACTTNNGGIIAWKAMNRILSSMYHPSLRKFQKSALRHWRENHLVTCIPAAGAASRFFGDLHKFISSVEERLPVLQEIILAKRNKKSFQLDDETRKNIQTNLENFKITPDIATLYEAVHLQEYNEVKILTQSYLSFINQVILNGGMTLQNVVTNDFANRSFKREESYTVRKPWEYEKLSTNKESLLTLNDSNYNQIQNRTSSQPSNWMDRIHLKKTHSKKEDIVIPIYFNKHAENILKAYATSISLVEKYASLPKAFVPTTTEGDSFLMLKMVEQVSLLACLGNVLVVPANMKTEFEQDLESLIKNLQENVNDIFSLRNSPFAPTWLKDYRKPNGKWVVLEQGRKLSTIRFNTDGSPYVTDDNKYSPVSAGHGELVHLFDDIAQEFPEAECLHIRNIDNVIGSSIDRFNEMNVLAESFKVIRDSLEYLRVRVEEYVFESHLQPFDDERALQVLSFLAKFIDETIGKEALESCYDLKGKFAQIPYQTIHKILGNLFHWQPLPDRLSLKDAWEQTLKLLEQPLSIFGVVRKEVGDQGGGPVFAKIPGGKTIKLCMEMPHANEQDSLEYFGHKGKATHFNPVLAFFELRIQKAAFEKEGLPGKKVDFSKLLDENFWLLSKREIKGKSVCYHETVLHELTGNSERTNLIFVEVPRTLFKPHKSYFDSLSNDRRSYGFDETLATSETGRNF